MKNMMPRITLISDWSQESLAEYLGGTMTLPKGQNEQKLQKSSAYSDRMMVDWRSKSQSCSAKTSMVSSSAWPEGRPTPIRRADTLWR